MIIREKLNTPYVKLDMENCNLTIIGKSYPKHAALFYGPILLEASENRINMKNSKFRVKLALEIMNSVSTKYIFMLLTDLSEHSSEMEVTWYYEDDDESMLDDGNILKNDLPGSTFKLVGVTDLRLI
jgi:hypothetical protein